MYSMILILTLGLGPVVEPCPKGCRWVIACEPPPPCQLVCYCPEGAP